MKVSFYLVESILCLFRVIYFNSGFFLYEYERWVEMFIVIWVKIFIFFFDEIISKYFFRVIRWEIYMVYGLI